MSLSDRLVDLYINLTWSLSGSSQGWKGYYDDEEDDDYGDDDNDDDVAVS